VSNRLISVALPYFALPAAYVFVQRGRTGARTSRQQTN